MACSKYAGKYFGLWRANRIEENLKDSGSDERRQAVDGEGLNTTEQDGGRRKLL